jgi:hypothetical protein
MDVICPPCAPNATTQYLTISHCARPSVTATTESAAATKRVDNIYTPANRAAIDSLALIGAQWSHD